MEFLDSLKGMFFGGILQDDDKFLNRYLPNAYVSRFTPEQQAEYAEVGRDLVKGNLFGNDRTQTVQRGLLAEIAAEKSLAAQERAKSIQDSINKRVGFALQPTMTPEMALLARGGQAGPTKARAEMIGQKNPMMAQSPNAAYREAYEQAALKLGGVDRDLAEFYAQQAELADPRFKTKFVEEVVLDGKPYKFIVDEYGRKRELGVAPDKLIEVNAGGTKYLVSEKTRDQVGKVNVTMTPTERDTSARGWAELNKPVIKDTNQGLVAVDPRTLKSKTIVGEDGQPLRGQTGALPEGVINAQGFADRMVQAEGILGDLGMTPGTTSQLIKSIPQFGNLASNIFSTPQEQQYYNAAQDWIRAKLRKESGAAIGDQEMADEYATYFPMVGDSEAVLAQKAQLRKTATEAMIRAGGPTYQRPKVSSGGDKPPQGNGQNAPSFSDDYQKRKAELTAKYGVAQVGLQ